MSLNPLVNDIVDKMKSVHHSVLHMISIQKTDGQVTVRHRDSMEQARMPIAEVKAYIEKQLEF